MWSSKALGDWVKCTVIIKESIWTWQHGKKNYSFKFCEVQSNAYKFKDIVYTWI